MPLKMWKAPLDVGSVAPPFSVFTDAGPFDLAATNRPILLEVFATWSSRSRHEVAVLNRLSRKYRARMSFLAVCVSTVANAAGTPESTAHVNAFAQTLQVAYPVAYDPMLSLFVFGPGITRVSDETRFPTIVIIKRDKTIAYIDHGEISARTLEKEIVAALER